LYRHYLVQWSDGMGRSHSDLDVVTALTHSPWNGGASSVAPTDRDGVPPLAPPFLDTYGN
jgi:hypothetical protein